jgi:septum formation protein
MQKLILASASPRRREILTLAGVPFEVVVAAEETAPADLSPADYTQALARCKAEAVFVKHPDRVVLGADTIVVLGDTVLGKPRSEQEAVEMLLSLSGRTHQVMTGVWVCSPDRCEGFTDVASVHFYPLTREEAERYVATMEPMDKAGSYAIQGLGMRFVRGIDGDFYTVMGLPVAALCRRLRKYEPLILG